jgi:Uma2 family endonuclease
MSTQVKPQADSLVEALYYEEGKAEIINGEIVRFMATGRKPSRASLRIVMSLMDYEETEGGGLAVEDNAGFIVNLPHRQSFSPDAAWYVGPEPTPETEMNFFEGAPAFAAEVRSKSDYGPQAELDWAVKRRDYFAAGTVVVWDVDLLSEDVVKVYRATAPDDPVIYRRGELAEAEPAVPGWRMPVDELFR